MANEDYSNTDLLNRKNAMLDMVNRLQQTFLSETTSNEVFENALKMLLDITESEYGFIGEVLQNSEGQPFLKTKSITNIAWNEATRKFYEEKAPKGLEFTNLNTLFGVVLKTGRAIIANEPSTHPQRGGLPEGPLLSMHSLACHFWSELKWLEWQGYPIGLVDTMKI